MSIRACGDLRTDINGHIALLRLQFVHKPVLKLESYGSVNNRAVKIGGG